MIDNCELKFVNQLPPISTLPLSQGVAKRRRTGGLYMASVCKYKGNENIGENCNFLFSVTRITCVTAFFLIVNTSV